jgi:hypothetical protein
MKYKRFKEVIEKLVNLQKSQSEIYKIGIDLVEREEPYHEIISILWDEILTKEGKDWLEWFLYEKGAINGKPRKDMKAWDKDGKEICKDLKGLHEYLSENNCFLR